MVNTEECVEINASLFFRVIHIDFIGVTVMRKISLVISHLLKKLEIDLHDHKKNDELYKALRQLVTILFAVVLGVGLSQLKDLKCFYNADAFVLYLAYLAVVLSWYGYHFGIIAGPTEKNLLNYFIDCLLLIFYWLLINYRYPFSRELLWLAIMFLLYLVWEFIRLFQENTQYYKDSIEKAILANAAVALLLLVIRIFSNDEYIWLSISLVYIILVSYRISIYRIYILSPKTVAPEVDDKIETLLIAKAKVIAANAIIKISQYPVGAAIRSNNGKIYIGCNIEFDNLSNTIHAEESAISSLVADGEKCPTHIAVYTSSDVLCFPCGLCRQSLFELGGYDLKVIACNDSKHEVKTIRELLPEGFKL